MEEYRIWLSWRVEHEYYAGGVCRSVELLPDRDSCELFFRRGLRFKKMAVNRWILTGEKGVEWEAGDRVVVERKITDPGFYYVTEGGDEKWETDLMETVCGQEVRIGYGAKSLCWEYILIARKKGSDKPLQVREYHNRIVFAEPVKDWLYGREVWKVTSVSPVKLCENYDYRIQLVRNEAFGERLICKDMPFPFPGQFAFADRGCIRQVVYY